MITLKQLLKEQEMLGKDGLTDIQIIKSFLTLNDLNNYNKIKKEKENNNNE